MTIKLSAFVITKNEEQKIARCLQHLSWTDEIIVLDSGSTDATISLAKKFTKKVFTRSFEGYGPQKQAAINKCSNNWILEVDADEVVSKELQQEITSLLARPELLEHHTAYSIPRQEYFLGKSLFQSRIVRLYRKDAVAYQGEIHERLVIQGTAGSLQHPLFHESDQYETIADRITKINMYTKKEAEILFSQQPNIFVTFFKMLTFPFVYFVWQYFFQGLVFRGYRGLIWSLLTAYYHFLIYAKVYEYIYKEKHFSSGI